jgi:hypothetical protein
MKGALSASLWGDMTHNRIDSVGHALHTGGLRQLTYDGSFASIKHNLITNTENLYYFTTTTDSGGGGKEYNSYHDVQQNTFISVLNKYPGALFFHAGVGDPKTSIFKNNLIVDARALGGSDSGVTGSMWTWADYDYNFFDNVPNATAGSDTMDWITWQTTHSNDVNSETDGDAGFVGGGDYHLDVGSAAWTAGEGGAAVGCYVTGAEEIGVRT